MYIHSPKSNFSSVCPFKYTQNITRAPLMITQLVPMAGRSFHETFDFLEARISIEFVLRLRIDTSSISFTNFGSYEGMWFSCKEYRFCDVLASNLWHICTMYYKWFNTLTCFANFHSWWMGYHHCSSLTEHWKLIILQCKTIPQVFTSTPLFGLFCRLRDCTFACPYYTLLWP